MLVDLPEEIAVAIAMISDIQDVLSFASTCSRIRKALLDKHACADTHGYSYEWVGLEKFAVEMQALPNGERHFYNRKNGLKRLMRVEGLPEDRVEYYRGSPGCERLVKEDIRGQLWHYKGPKGAERLVLEECEGDRYHHEGPKGSEHLVAIEFPGGRIEYYNGGVLTSTKEGEPYAYSKKLAKKRKQMSY